MNITAKSRYALKITLDLAAHHEQGRQKRNDIAVRQGVSIDFMDQIVARLRSYGIVQSIRGPNGGFILSRSPKDINLWDIFSAVEDGIYPVRCLEESSCCDIQHACIASGPWQEVFNLFRNNLRQITLADLVNRWVKPSDPNPMNTPPMRMECKGSQAKIWSIQKETI